ncbi:hypothetical protein GTU67_07900 [Pusillimonas sp. 7-48]|uniref:protein-tyrosine-phosphatase n=2 Tax=Pusillimonas minor TaxID=2697024 RepID=A0A842HSM0_9BURK|nr:hypothetical protein [Pusillimonas minor]
MAEVLMRHALQQQGINAQVVSRGLAAPAGRSPHPFAQATANHFGLPLDPQKRSAPVNLVDFQAATVVLVMDQGHRRDILQRYPQAGGKTFLLRHWNGGHDLADPLHAPETVFREQWPLMQEACTEWATRLLQAGMLAKATPNP